MRISLVFLWFLSLSFVSLVSFANEGHRQAREFQKDVSEEFQGSSSALTDAEKKAMLGVTWRVSCPVALDEIRVLRFLHHDAHGEVAEGELLAHESVAEDWLFILGALFDQNFVIEKARPMREYSGDDDKSMRDNNTSGFNCRQRIGGNGFSKHAFGVAIDVNPLWNPYVKKRGERLKIAPETGDVFVKRERRMGTILRRDDVVRLFRLFGFTWGGRWRSAQDYQHFEPLAGVVRPALGSKTDDKRRARALKKWQKERVKYVALQKMREKRNQKWHLLHAQPSGPEKKGP